MKFKTVIISGITSLFATVSAAQIIHPWLNVDVGSAWKLGYKGQNTTITVVDDFRSYSLIRGKLTNVIQVGRHGQWTSMEASLVAPLALIKNQDYSFNQAVSLNKGLNIINLSYGILAPRGYSTINWSAQESSIINHARNGTAIVSKAAGNDGGIAVGSITRSGQLDYLNRDLIGSKTTIFVGALNTNGTTAAPATVASYSNVAGNNPIVQNQFLMVGVESHKTGLSGTSFAAPIISGYAAILGSKFTTATPTQITNQLLNTARKDTIRGYNIVIHGRGEASLSRALSPVSIK